MSAPRPSPSDQQGAHTDRWSAVSVTAALLATATEFGIVAASVLHATPVSVLVAIHLGVGLSLWLTVMRFADRDRGDPAFLLFAISTAALGPLGPPGTALTMLLHRRFARRATPFDAWYATLFPRIMPTPTRTLYGRLVLRGGGPPKRGTVAPFLDVMALGSVQQKQAVIAMIADEFRPAFAPALRSALNDAEPAIRVQAATAFARIETRFLTRSMILKARQDKAPDDADVLLDLARHHEECAASGILDDGRVRVELTEALAYRERAHAMRPDDLGVAEAVARLVLRLGRLEEALPRLRSLAARSDAAPEVRREYHDCLFRLGDFGALRDACRPPWSDADGSTIPEGDTFGLWSRGAANRALAGRVALGAPASHAVATDAMRAAAGLSGPAPAGGTAEFRHGDILPVRGRHPDEPTEAAILDEGRARVIVETMAGLMLRIGRPREALRRLQPLAARPDASLAVLAGYFDCLFRLGHFAGDRGPRGLSGGANLAIVANGVSELLRLWSAAAAEPGAPASVASGSGALAAAMLRPVSEIVIEGVVLTGGPHQGGTGTVTNASDDDETAPAKTPRPAMIAGHKAGRTVFAAVSNGQKPGVSGDATSRENPLAAVREPRADEPLDPVIRSDTANAA